jgi:hypothetical protein
MIECEVTFRQVLLLHRSSNIMRNGIHATLTRRKQLTSVGHPVHSDCDLCKAAMELMAGGSSLKGGARPRFPVSCVLVLQG